MTTEVLVYPMTDAFDVLDQYRVLDRNRGPLGENNIGTAKRYPDTSTYVDDVRASIEGTRDPEEKQVEFNTIRDANQVSDILGGLEIVTDPSQPEIRTIGYYVDEKRWGEGIATAAVAAAIERIRDMEGVVEVDAYAADTNPASIAVLQKNGLQVDEEYVDPEEKGNVRLALTI